MKEKEQNTTQQCHSLYLFSLFFFFFACCCIIITIEAIIKLPIFLFTRHSFYLIASILFHLFIYYTVPPKSIKITDEKGTEIEEIIGPFNEDSSLLLVCIVTGGKKKVFFPLQQKSINKKCNLRFNSIRLGS